MTCALPLAADAKPKRQPEPDRSMRFAVVRASSPSCEPICPEWIWAEGEIAADTATRFKKFLKTIGKRKLPVVIQSPGGRLDAAFAMGRMIRAKGLDVAVGYTTFTSCAPRQEGCKPEGGYTGVAATGFAYCNSACPMVLAGGARRLVGTWAHLGVHQVTTTMVKEKILYRTTTRIVKGKKVTTKKVVSRKKAGSFTTTEMSKRLRREIAGYLKEMGVSTDLIEPIKKTAASDILKLEQVEMLELKLITGLEQVDLLTDPSICKQQPMPANCREIPLGKEKETAPSKAKTAKAETGKPKQLEPARDQRTNAKAAKANANGAGVHQVRARPGQPDFVPPDNPEHMHFRLVRSDSSICKRDCPEWISAEGTITSSTPDRLREFLDKLGDRRLPVVMSSAGGDVLGAMAAGRLIRERKLDVAIARTKFSGCAPGETGCTPGAGVFLGNAVDSDGECRAACPLLLAGGVRRLVGPDATLTVRQLGLRRLTAEYLGEMAIEPLFFDMMMLSAQLDPDRQLITTGRGSATDLVGPSVCKSAPRPNNCRAVSTTQ